MKRLAICTLVYIWYCILLYICIPKLRLFRPILSTWWTSHFFPDTTIFTYIKTTIGILFLINDFKWLNGSVFYCWINLLPWWIGLRLLDNFLAALSLVSDCFILLSLGEDDFPLVEDLVDLSCTRAITLFSGTSGIQCLISGRSKIGLLPSSGQQK